MSTHKNEHNIPMEHLVSMCESAVFHLTKLKTGDESDNRIHFTLLYAIKARSDGIAMAAPTDKHLRFGQYVEACVNCHFGFPYHPDTI